MNVTLTSSATVNRDLLRAATDAAGGLDYLSTNSPPGTYDLASHPDGGYWRHHVPLKVFMPGITFRLIPPEGAAPMSYHGIVTDDPVDQTIVGLTIEGAGATSGQAIRHGYSGSAPCKVTLDGVTTRGCAYGLKIQGGCTDSEMSRADLEGWITGYIHAHSSPNVAPTSRVRPTKTHFRAKSEPWATNFLVYGDTGPGHTNPTGLATEHGVYLAPALDVVMRQCEFHGARFHAYQCNGALIAGRQELIDCIVHSTCTWGVQGHLVSPLRIRGGVYKPINTAIHAQGGGFWISDDALIASVGNGTYAGAVPLAAIAENGNAEHFGGLVEDSRFEMTPGQAMFSRTRATSLPWVFRRTDIIQDKADYPHGMMLLATKTAEGAVTEFQECHVDWKRGRLYDMSTCPRSAFIVDAATTWNLQPGLLPSLRYGA